MNNNNDKNSSSLNLDLLIDGLSSDIKSVNNFMANLNNQKKQNKELEQVIINERKKLEKDKKDFENFVKLTTAELDTMRKTQEININTQKLNLAKAEVSFKENMDNTLSELELAKKELELKEKRIEEEKEQFNKTKEIELDRLKHESEVLQFEREQFKSYREVTTKKMEAEKKNLEQQFSKFKEIIDQFNLSFKASDVDTEE